MSNPILVSGAAGGPQGSTGRNITNLLLDRGLPVRALVRKLQAPPYYENVRALISRSVSEKNTVFLPWGEGSAVFPLVGAEDVARVAATLLANPGEPPRRAYELTGAVPTLNEIVETLGRVLRRPIRYVQITDEQWAEAVKDRRNRPAPTSTVATIGAYALQVHAEVWKRTSNAPTGIDRNTCATDIQCARHGWPGRERS